MGADTFTHLAPIADANKAFASAVEEARYEHGHARYTGTIAEKGDFRIITRQPIPLQAAEDLAWSLIEQNDPRVDDKWGPAGAIPVILPNRDVTVDELNGNRDDLLALATERARAKKLIRRGEKPIRANLISYVVPSSLSMLSRPGTPRILNGTATLTLAKGKTALANQTQPDGWLFFGWASC